jgi:hypothetical protein
MSYWGNFLRFGFGLPLKYESEDAQASQQIDPVAKYLTVLAVDRWDNRSYDAAAAPKSEVVWRPKRHKPKGPVRAWRISQGYDQVGAYHVNVVVRMDCSYSECKKGQHNYSIEVGRETLRELHFLGADISHLEVVGEILSLRERRRG